MKPRKYQITYKFFETNNFNKSYGKISESVRDDLYFYLMIGRGELIENTAGLKEIRCGIAGADGKEGWDVVFADYNYPEMKEHLYFLLRKFPIDFIRTLNQQQKRKLRMMKEKLDEIVGNYYWTLMDSD